MLHGIVQLRQGEFEDAIEKIWIEGKSEKFEWESLMKYEAEFDHPLWKRWKDQALDSGHRGADYFEIGGRWSGSLILHRLKAIDAKHFNRFWKDLDKIDSGKCAIMLFRKAYPMYRGKIPIRRNQRDFFGSPDDAQIMDGTLYKQLKRHYVHDVSYQFEFGKADVICTENDVDWPPEREEVIGKYWVVVVDYHD